LIAG